MKITLHTAMQDFGQMADGVSAALDTAAPALTPEDFVCTGCFSDLGAVKPIPGIRTVSAEGNTLRLTMPPFLLRANFAIECVNPALALKITRETADIVELYHEDLFRPIEESGVRYRLYEPSAYGPRPLVLYLHGGGGCGEDNLLQLTDTIGAIKLAERVPDMYVLAPQAPSGGYSMEEMMAKFAAAKDHFKVVTRSDPENGRKDRGWTRWYLGKVCGIIRRMIDEGKVDARRVYVIGMSMGGCGTLKAAAVAPDLFAACVPICPSMNGETWPILDNFPPVPAYISTAYIDHQVDRHAYLLRAVQKLWDQGRKDIRYTLFTSDELAAYGIGITENISTTGLYEENHNSWILVLHNEYGILDWMFSHVKNG